MHAFPLKAEKEKKVDTWRDVAPPWGEAASLLKPQVFNW